VLFHECRQQTNEEGEPNASSLTVAGEGLGVYKVKVTLEALKVGLEALKTGPVGTPEAKVSFGLTSRLSRFRDAISRMPSANLRRATQLLAWRRTSSLNRVIQKLTGRLLGYCAVITRHIGPTLIKNQRYYFTNAINEPSQPTYRANQMLACRRTSSDNL
jgi:hypothetical protein